MNNQELDPQVVNLAKSIRQVESGGNFKAVGKSGEYGAYQYTEPTWNEDSQKYLGRKVNLKDATDLEQNEVAYKKLADLKSQGYNVGQIASIWNSGSPEWEGKVGTNKYGVKYDVPKYVDTVANTYQQYKRGEIPNITSQTSSTVENDNTPTKNESPLKKYSDFIGNVSTGVASVPISIAKGIGDLVGLKPKELGEKILKSTQETDEGTVGKKIGKALGWTGASLATLGLGKGLYDKFISSKISSSPVIENILGGKQLASRLSNSEKYNLLEESLSGSQATDKLLIKNTMDKLLPSVAKELGIPLKQLSNIPKQRMGLLNKLLALGYGLDELKSLFGNTIDKYITQNIPQQGQSNIIEPAP